MSKIILHFNENLAKSVTFRNAHAYAYSKDKRGEASVLTYKLIWGFARQK